MNVISSLLATHTLCTCECYESQPNINVLVLCTYLDTLALLVLLGLSANFSRGILCKCIVQLCKRIVQLRKHEYCNEWRLTFCSMFNVPLQTERQFEQALKATRGLMIKKMRPDGACLFRAVGESLFFIVCSLPFLCFYSLLFPPWLCTDFVLY